MVLLCFSFLDVLYSSSHQHSLRWMQKRSEPRVYSVYYCHVQLTSHLVEIWSQKGRIYNLEQRLILVGLTVDRTPRSAQWRPWPDAPLHVLSFASAADQFAIITKTIRCNVSNAYWVNKALPPSPISTSNDLRQYSIIFGVFRFPVSFAPALKPSTAYSSSPKEKGSRESIRARPSKM